MRICVLKLGTTFKKTRERYGDFDAWTALGLGLRPSAVDVVAAIDGESIPDLSEYAGVVATGSHAMVTDRLPWSEAAAARVAEIAQRGIPYLGICYGHQLLAYATGGQVGYLAGGPEIGTTDVQVNTQAASDPLFGEAPETFPAHVTHAQTVHELPPEAVLLARSDREPHHAFRLGSAAWGVQFHPEYTPAIMRDYMIEQQLASKLSLVRETAFACSILRRFAAFCGERETAETQDAPPACTGPGSRA